MSDDHRPDGAPADDLELASAYLDGVADDEQRATVDGSSVLLAQVAELARVRAALAVTPRPTGSARDAALTAALAAFDDARAAGSATTEPAEVRPIPRRVRTIAWVGSAAAAVVLAVFAVVTLGGGSQDGGGDVAFEQTNKEATDSATDAPTAMSATDSSDVATAGGAEVAPDDTSNATNATNATIGAIVGPATVLPAADSPAELSAYARSAPVEGASDLVPVPTCLPADVEIIGSVTVLGTPATVVRTPTGGVLAVDAACTTLLSTEP